MERLTEKTVGCFEYALKDHKAVPGEFGTYDAFFDYSMAVKRLGHYEDTGLEPEEISDAVTAAKLMARSKIVSCFGVDADHIRELVQAEQAGRLAVLPCKVGEYWRDWEGERVRIESVSFSFTRRHLCNTDMVTYRYDDEEDDFAVNWIYFKSHFTREEEAAMKGGED